MDRQQRDFVVQNFLDDIISEFAKGNRLEFRDFGVFETAVVSQLDNPA